MHYGLSHWKYFQWNTLVLKCWFSLENLRNKTPLLHKYSRYTVNIWNETPLLEKYWLYIGNIWNKKDKYLFYSISKVLAKCKLEIFEVILLIYRQLLHKILAHYYLATNPTEICFIRMRILLKVPKNIYLQYWCSFGKMYTRNFWDNITNT